MFVLSLQRYGQWICLFQSFRKICIVVYTLHILYILLFHLFLSGNDVKNHSLGSYSDFSTSSLLPSQVTADTSQVVSGQYVADPDLHFFRDEDPVLAKKTDPGLCTSNEGRFKKKFKANILDQLKSLLFLFQYFWCQTYHRCARFRKPARIRIR